MADEMKITLWGRISAFLARFLSYLIMSVFAFMTVYPIIWLIMNSFKTNTEYRMSPLGLPGNPTFRNYIDAWRIGDFSKLIGNSVAYTIGSTVGVILLSVLAGFGFAKIKNKATPLIYGSFVIGILLTIQSLMVPLFLQVQAIGLYDTPWVVYLIYIGSGMPIAIYLNTEFIKSIPDALVESARIDGANYFRIFRSIILPMTVPVATTVGILSITGYWNEFALINILVSKTALKSLPLGIMRFHGSLASDWGKQFAALVVGMLPMLLFYIIFRKRITKGVSAGAVKG